MSNFQDFLLIDLSTRKKLPEGVENYLKLRWMYHDLAGFNKPSPDQFIEEQKASGNRKQIIKKGGDPSVYCNLLTLTPTIKPKIQPKIDLPSLFKESDLQGVVPSVNIAIIGAHKAGKSSFFGWVKSMNEELDMHKLKVQSQKQGLVNGHLAWTSMTLKQEQSRLMSIGTSYYSVKQDKIYNFLDTPGHEDFTSETLSGLFFCDVAVLVADGGVRKGIDLKVINPSKKALFSAKACGINYLVIILSKLDLKKNPKEVTDKTQKMLIEAAKESGFKAENIRLVQGSLIENSFDKNILDEIKGFPVGKPGPDTFKPLRLVVEDRGKLVHGKLLGWWVSGFLISGIVKTGDQVSINGLTGSIKVIQKAEEKVEKAICGDFVDIVLAKIEGDPEEITRGQVMTHLKYEQRLSQSFLIRGLTNDPMVPILNKQDCVLHLLNFKTQVKISKIVRQFQNKNEKLRPRNLRGKTMGDLQISVGREIPCDLFKSVVRLARCVLTYQNLVIFCGMITNIA